MARHLMFRCPTTDQAVRLGLAAEDSDEVQIRTGAVVECAACHAQHTLDTASDVFLGDEVEE